MPMKLPSTNKKPRSIRWDAEPTLPGPSAGWEKMVAIGFATALGAGAVAFATILMVVSPAESEWQPGPMTARLASAGADGSSAAAGGKVATALAEQPRLADQRVVSLAAAAPAEGTQAVALSNVAAARFVLPETPALGDVTAAAPAVQGPESTSAAAPEPNEQRWARSAVADPAEPQEAAAESAIENSAGPATLVDQPEELQVAAIPLSALVAQPVRPAELLEGDEETTESAEPTAPRKLRLSSSANLRARPANGAKVLGTISGGTSVGSFGCKGGWCEVSVNGKRGFIAARFLGEKSKVRRASVSPSKKRAVRNKKRAPRRKAAASTAAPVARTQEATLPGVFAKVPTATDGDR